jgi:Gluconate 2-dehydrogenase subunit 3
VETPNCARIEGSSIVAPMTLTRRDLIRLVGGAVAAYAARGCSSSPRGDAIFSADQLAMLRGFADVVIPEDDEPGGAKLGVVEYIEGLITAFDTMASPRIFAGGPFSDRNPNPDGTVSVSDFTSFIELDRVKDAAWRLTVLGSQGLPNGAPNEAILGPVVGIADQVKAGLDTAIALAQRDIADLSPDDFQRLFNATDTEFQTLMIELTIEGAFCAPEYGGNLALAGWDLCHFEGDSLPRGYSQFDGSQYLERPEAPLSTANPSDPEPLTDELRQTLKLIVTVLGGRVS